MNDLYMEAGAGTSYLFDSVQYVEPVFKLLAVRFCSPAPPEGASGAAGGDADGFGDLDGDLDGDDDGDTFHDFEDSMV